MTEENRANREQRQAIGYIIGGGLKANLFVRLDVPAQSVQEGGFVVIESGEWLFYGLVTDLQLGALDPRYAEGIVYRQLSPHIAAQLRSQTLFTNLEVLPALMLERGPELDAPDYPNWRREHPEDPRPLPIKTVPAHHARAFLASAGDVAEIFGSPNDPAYFEIGRTREQNHPVCINLDKFVQRSSGIFGATGTGKSFLTRILLAGLIHRNQASILVLDMHNEYGYDDVSSDTGKAVSASRPSSARPSRSSAWGAAAPSAAKRRIFTSNSSNLKSCRRTSNSSVENSTCAIPLPPPSML